jgi:hypothetical protein
MKKVFSLVFYFFHFFILCFSSDSLPQGIFIITLARPLTEVDTAAGQTATVSTTVCLAATLASAVTAAVSLTAVRACIVVVVVALLVAGILHTATWRRVAVLAEVRTGREVDVG